MIEGTLIMESLRVGTNLENLTLTVRKISKYRAGSTTPAQPGIWTTLDFETDEALAFGSDAHRPASVARDFANAAAMAEAAGFRSGHYPHDFWRRSGIH